MLRGSKRSVSPVAASVVPWGKRMPVAAGVARSHATELAPVLLSAAMQERRIASGIAACDPTVSREALCSMVFQNRV